MRFSRFSFFIRSRGQGLVEYALILVLIAILSLGALGVLGNRTSAVFSDVDTNLCVKQHGNKHLGEKVKCDK